MKNQFTLFLLFCLVVLSFVVEAECLRLDKSQRKEVCFGTWSGHVSGLISHKEKKRSVLVHGSGCVSGCAWPGPAYLKAGEPGLCLLMQPRMNVLEGPP